MHCSSAAVFELLKISALQALSVISLIFSSHHYHARNHAGGLYNLTSFCINHNCENLLSACVFGQRLFANDFIQLFFSQKYARINLFSWLKKIKKGIIPGQKEKEKKRKFLLYSMTLNCTVIAFVAQITKSEILNNQALPVSSVYVASVNIAVTDEVPTHQLSVGEIGNDMYCRCIFTFVTL